MGPRANDCINTPSVFSCSFVACRVAVARSSWASVGLEAAATLTFSMRSGVKDERTEGSSALKTVWDATSLLPNLSGVTGEPDGPATAADVVVVVVVGWAEYTISWNVV